MKMNQKTHRERHQPKAREQLGLLEKKKDYVLRANDQKEKLDTLKFLQKKTLNKNPDEFYHHMKNSKIKNDEHFEKEKEEEISKEEKKLMETQDKKYIIMKRTIEQRKIERLQRELVLSNKQLKTQCKHIYFLDADEAKDDECKKKIVKSSLKNNTIFAEVNSSSKQKELQKRIQRLGELKKIEKKLEWKNMSKKQRRVMNDKEITKITKSPNEIFKIKYERKK
jgi:U3 small nucleolar RNA-associated protein 11